MDVVAEVRLTENVCGLYFFIHGFVHSFSMSSVPTAWPARSYCIMRLELILQELIVHNGGRLAKKKKKGDPM